MEENKMPDVPYLAHEEEMTRMERNVKRWFIGWIITFAALVLTNIGWVVYESQFEDIVSTQTVTQDSGEGGNNTFTGDFYGGDYNGEADSNTNN